MSNSPKICSGTKRKNEESVEDLTQNDERTGDDLMDVLDANFDGMPELLGSCTSNANSGGNANSAATCFEETEENGDEENNEEGNGSGPSITPGQPPRDEDEEVPVPEPLLQLKNNGLSFVGVPKNTWSFDRWAANLRHGRPMHECRNSARL